MADAIPDPLVERIRGHDAAALAAYMDARKPALMTFIEHRLGAALRGKLEPADVYQELAIKAIRELPNTEFGDREPFNWLCHLGEQCIVDGHRHFAAGKRSTGKEQPGNVVMGEGSQDFIALLAASVTSPTQAVVRNERTKRLLDALATLPAEHREAIHLRYGQGLSTKDVAKKIGKSDVATRVLLSRVVQKLQEMLGPGEEG